MELELVNNQPQFWEFLRKLRFNPQVKSGFINQRSETTPEEHRESMLKYGNLYFVCLCDGNPVGYIGHFGGDIRIATEPEFQRRGIGTFMVKEFMKRHSGTVAKIKIENKASIKLFEKCGFKLKYFLYEQD